MIKNKRKHVLIIFLFIQIVLLFEITAENYTPFQAMANPDYLVTVGDIYSLTYLTGRGPVDYKIIVDMSYRIRVANLGVINARGLTFYQLKRQVENIVARNYPLSGIQFIMTSVGSFPVQIIGEVKQSSQITVTALSRLSSVIKPLLTEYSSIRDVEVIYSNGVTKKFDLFKTYRSGDFLQDPYLRPNSKVKINKVKRTVDVSGGIKRPGKYQLLDNENLSEVINFYGDGGTEFGDVSQVTVTRILKDDNAPHGSTITLNSKKEIDAFKLKNYDKIYITDTATMRQTVYFEGSLNSKSKIIPIQFMKGENLVSILRRNRSLFSSMSDTKNAYLLRNGKKIYEDFNRIFFDETFNEEILLEPEDRIIVPFLQQVVIVTGAVLRPGSYPYVPGKTYEYYISLAGGFDTNRNLGSAVRIKDVSGKKMKKTDTILPDSSIYAKSNSFLYNFGRYIPLISTLATVVSMTISIITFTRR